MSGQGGRRQVSEVSGVPVSHSLYWTPLYQYRSCIPMMRWASFLVVAWQIKIIIKMHGALHYTRYTLCISCAILPSSRPMTMMSGVLESSRQALSIRYIISLIGRLLRIVSVKKVVTLRITRPNPADTWDFASNVKISILTIRQPFKSYFQALSMNMKLK